MGQYDYIALVLDCRKCRHSHSTSLQVRFALNASSRSLEVGDRIGLHPKPEDVGYMRGFAAPGGQMNFLEDPVACGDDRVWPRITVEDGRIDSIQLIQLNRDSFSSIHYFTDRVRGWADDLPNPSDWNDDLYSKDRIRMLRFQLLIREVMPARNLREVALAIETFGCVALATPARAGSVWTFRCQPSLGNPIELRFDVDDERPIDPADVVELPGPGFSQIVPPEAFANLIDEHTGWIGAVPYGYDKENWQSALRHLRQGIFYIEELLRFIPEDETFVPLDAFWSDAGLEERRLLPSRFERNALESLLAEKREILVLIEREPLPDK